MKRRLVFFAAIFSLLMVYGIPVAHAVEGSRDEIILVIEKSALSREEKVRLLKLSKEAVNKGIPSSDIAIILGRGFSRALGSKAMEESISFVIQMKEQNLPVRPVIDRLQQGLSKGVPYEKISTATKRLTEKLAAADGIINNLDRSGVKAGREAEKGEAVQTVARALEKSIPEDSIAKIGAKSSHKNLPLTKFSTAISTMTTFVEMGMPVDHASKLINKAIDKGYSEKDMMMMEMEMSHMLKDGWKMEDAMKGMESYMNMGSSSELHKGMGEGFKHGMGPGGGTSHHGHH